MSRVDVKTCCSISIPVATVIVSFRALFGKQLCANSSAFNRSGCAVALIIHCAVLARHNFTVTFLAEVSGDTGDVRTIGGFHMERKRRRSLLLYRIHRLFKKLSNIDPPPDP